jgi:hypothetical protein
MNHPFADDPQDLGSENAHDPELAASIASRCNSALIASIAALFLMFFCCSPGGIILGYLMYQRASGLIEEIAMTNEGRASLGIAKTARILAAIALVLSVCTLLFGIMRLFTTGMSTRG